MPTFATVGIPLGYRGTGSDNAERKHVEAEVIMVEKQAEYADRARSAFLSNMSHELRTPLNAIMGFADMMRQQIFGPVGDPRYQDYMDNIYESSEQFLNLINDILDLSMIEGGEIKIIERDLDVEKTLNLSTKLIKVCAAEKNQILRIDALVHGTKLRADECMVRQILLKLLSNAIKFAKSSVEITIAGELGEDGRLRISVFDTGIGMLDAMSALGQVEGALYQRIEGTALDLPLVKSLAELHDGGFEVNSEVDFGTKATVWFPKERVFSADGSVSSSSSSFDQSSSLYQSTNS